MLLVLQTGLCLEAGSVLQTGRFRESLQWRKGKGFLDLSLALYLSLLHGISKTWHSCLLLSFVRGEVNTDTLN